MKIKDSDIHHHLNARMLQKGISREEIEITINKGWSAEDAKEGTNFCYGMKSHTSDRI